MREPDVARVAGLQAADALAEHASRNSGDAEYESPYTEEAIRSGMDLPWWQKIITTSLDFGELKLGKLTVSVRHSTEACVPWQPVWRSPTSAIAMPRSSSSVLQAGSRRAAAASRGRPQAPVCPGFGHESGVHCTRRQHASLRSSQHGYTAHVSSRFCCCNVQGRRRHVTQRPGKK